MDVEKREGGTLEAYDHPYVASKSSSQSLTLRTLGPCFKGGLSPRIRGPSGSPSKEEARFGALFSMCHRGVSKKHGPLFGSPRKEDHGTLAPILGPLVCGPEPCMPRHPGLGLHRQMSYGLYYGFCEGNYIVTISSWGDDMSSGMVVARNTCPGSHGPSLAS